MSIQIYQAHIENLNVSVQCKDKAVADKLKATIDWGLKIGPKFKAILEAGKEYPKDPERCVQRLLEVTQRLIKDKTSMLEGIRIAVKCYFLKGINFLKYNEC